MGLSGESSHVKSGQEVGGGVFPVSVWRAADSCGVVDLHPEQRLLNTPGSFFPCYNSLACLPVSRVLAVSVGLSFSLGVSASVCRSLSK